MQAMQLFLLFAAIVGSLAANVAAAAADFEEFSTQRAAITAAAAEATAIDIDAVPITAFVDDDFDFSAIAAQSLPSITPCSISDPDRNECIRDLFSQIVPLLKADLPAYNMAAIDPYFYKRGIFRYANDGIQGGLLIKNMQIQGISDIKVSNVLSNFTDNAFIIKLSAEIPQLKAGGTFKADVKFGGLRLAPKGLFNITLDNIKANILTDGFIESTDFGQRVQLKRLNANIAIGSSRIAANGIFSDNNLNTMILNLVNENLPEIIRVGVPATRDQWAPILVEHINAFFANVPIDKLLVQ